MKLQLIIFTCLSFILINPATSIAQTEYRSKQSGDWTQASTWEVKQNNSWVNATTVPSGTRTNISFTVRSGHTVVLDNTVHLTNLQIEKNAVLDGSVVKVVELRVGAGSSPFADNSSIINDGVIESPKLGINVWTTTAAFTLKGSGVYKLAHFRARGGNPNSLKVVIDQDIDIMQGNPGSNFTAFTNDKNDKATDNVTFTINEGKTVKIMGDTPFHLGSESSVSGAVGSYTYNINGVLDLGKGKRTTYIIPLTDNKNSLTTVNVNGTLKLGKSFNSNSKPSDAGRVIFNVKGNVDKSATKDLTLGSLVL